MLRRGLAYSLAIHGTIIAVLVLAQDRLPESPAMALDLTRLVLQVSPGAPSLPGESVALTGRPRLSGSGRAVKKDGQPASKKTASADVGKNTIAALMPSDQTARQEEPVEGKMDQTGDVVPAAAAESPGPASPVNGSTGPIAPGQGAGGSDGVFASAGLDNPPVAISRRPPAYPLRARREAIEGKVEIELLVNDHGGVDDVRIIAAQPPGVFEESVKQTVPGWRFKPGILMGRPVKTLVATTIRFELRNN
jgi:TonB family protein